MQPGVLIVRAPEHADALAKAVRKGLHGRQCHITTQSMVDTQALALPEGASVDWQATYHGIVVVSPAAVSYFDAHIQQHQQDWPQTNYYCVGAGTAEAMVPLSGQPATYPAPLHTAEALLELSALKNIEAQRWMVITGREGRTLIADTLRSRGAQVEVLEVYERVVREIDLRGPFSSWSEQVNIVVFTSQQHIELFTTAIERLDGGSDWLQTITWLVSSQRLQDCLLHYGIRKQQIVLATNASTPALTRSLLELINRSHAPALTKQTVNTDKSHDDSQPTTKSDTPVAVEQDTPQKAAHSDAIPTPKRSAFGLFISIVLLLCVVTLGVGGYYAWAQQEAFRQQTQAELSELNQRIADADRAQQSIRSDVVDRMDEQLQRRFNELQQQRQQEAQALREQAAAEREQMREEFEQHNAELTALKQQVDSANLRVSEDLFLVEARDLVLAAGRKLWLDHDRKTAIQLLERAENLLAAAEQNRLLPIRQQLRDDIELIASIEEQDIESLSMRVSTQRRQIRQLPFVNQTIGFDEGDDQATSSEFSEWRANLAKAWANFTDDFVRIQRTDELPSMKIGQEQRALLVSQIELQLQIAQQALMQRQTINYREALEQAAEWIESYFDTERQAVQRSLAELRELSGYDLDPAYPTRLLSEAMLRDVVEEMLEGDNR
ncbi:uncharacterized protein HemX [Aliidiomarina maris]|nr:uncharacterized protein HemX [Aliidiomarina maris]